MTHRRASGTGAEIMMSNFTDLKLFLVRDGEVFSESAAPESNEVDNILVAATTPEGALHIADAYENEQIEPQEMEWQGKKISVLTMRNPQTGLYF